MNFNRRLQPVRDESIFIDENYYIWGCSMERDEKGICHLFYSRWRRELGHDAWVTDSEIAHAISDNPLGPYKHKEVILTKRDPGFWDGLCSHNPTIHKFDGKFYLYYMGNSINRELDGQERFWEHRNNQRIGVAVAEDLNGPWTRPDKPLIDIGVNNDDFDSLMMSNPTICRRPDKSFLLIYKCAGKKLPPPKYGPVVHIAAFSNSPEGPFVKHDQPIFTSDKSNFPAEDPYIWYEDGRYWAILKDMDSSFTQLGRTIVLFKSEDGINWEINDEPLVSKLEINWKNRGIEEVFHLERPQLWIEDGKPTALFCAVDRLNCGRDHSFNVHIGIK